MAHWPSIHTRVRLIVLCNSVGSFQVHSINFWFDFFVTCNVAYVLIMLLKDKIILLCG